jgi:hypothetical protein
MVVEETIAYPRSGQPFQFTQRVTQDARNPSKDQMDKIMSLFDAAGKPVRGWHTNPVKRVHQPAQPDKRAFVDVGTLPGQPMYFPREIPPHDTANTMGGFNAGVVNQGRSQPVSDLASAGRRDMTDRDIRHMAELDFGKYNPMIDTEGIGTTLPDLTSVANTDRNQEFTYDHLSGGIVGTQHSGPEGGPLSAKWIPLSAWTGKKDYPIDAEESRARTGPLQVPSGGIVYGYSDFNKYTSEGQNDFVMADGQPWDPNKKMVGEGGKVYTGLAYTPPELNPHLDLLPSNHPMVLQMKHWNAAAVKNNLPPTEMRKGLEKTLIADVKRFRYLPKSFGGA